MATLVMPPQSDPATLAKRSTTTPSILAEVAASQEHLRSRLAGALTKPPSNIPADSLPSVPLIDIGASFDPKADSQAKNAIAQQIRQACLTTGFFQISNHGISTEAMAGVLKQAERFFHDLSPDQKEELHVKHSPLFRGYEPHDFSYVNPDDKLNGHEHQHQHETKEGFNWGYEAGLDPTGGDGEYVELDGQSPAATGPGNLWPSEEWLPGFYDAIKLYYGQVLQLARHLFRLFALSLALEEAYFDKVTTHPGGIARLLYYKSQPAVAVNGSTTAADGGAARDEGDAKLGLGAHTDYECFTLLLSSSNPGLEILFPPSPLTDDKPVWLPCPVRPGTLTVNVADFLMRWTNGLYKSTIHRVVSRPGSGQRYSVPFFFSINYDADVEALPEEVVGRSNYQPIKAGEYVLERLRATTM
ncbi:hypothetical protein A1O7_03120 [Cladophialophora yegresii CBS 114405]|uniref:Fe2OG dioxygenase domain-containing protein n=1 Tax=Cladophialophora yegresii CBS 114405 TaxID=1182544 RepID=W9W3P8_9EURO|nr:uncharacterized protein A1O7_03120 [Cladophialophora yegresii CBS 114405]EXJ62682.1 hypothetical protein A1O7_03120 [Cladophialophora yegresii CBS 114405]